MFIGSLLLRYFEQETPVSKVLKMNGIDRADLLSHEEKVLLRDGEDEEVVAKHVETIEKTGMILHECKVCIDAKLFCIYAYLIKERSMGQKLMYSKLNTELLADHVRNRKKYESEYFWNHNWNRVQACCGIFLALIVSMIGFPLFYLIMRQK